MEYRTNFFLNKVLKTTSSHLSPLHPQTSSDSASLSKIKIVLALLEYFEHLSISASLSPFFCFRMSLFYCLSPCSLLDMRLGFSWEKVTVWPIKENYEEALDAPEVSVSLAFH